MMKFNKEEKEFLKAVVKYNSSISSFANIINKSQIFEDKGIALVRYENTDYIFYQYAKYGEESTLAINYLTTVVSLIDYLIQNRLITVIRVNESLPLVIGKSQSAWINHNTIGVNYETEIIEYSFGMLNWHTKNQRETYWSYKDSNNELKLSNHLEYFFSISEELSDFITNGFRTKEDKRFFIQQIATWVSILISLIIGLLGIFKEQILNLF